MCVYVSIYLYVFFVKKQHYFPEVLQYFVFNPLVLRIWQFDGAQQPPAVVQDPGSKTVVQLRLPDGKPASNPSRKTHCSQLGSDYSLFDLETFFTRWAPDSECAAPRNSPSCSFTAGDSTDCGQDGVMMVDPETLPLQDSTSSALSIGPRPAFPSIAHIRPAGSQGSGYRHISAFPRNSNWVVPPHVYSLFFHHCFGDVLDSRRGVTSGMT